MARILDAMKKFFENDKWPFEHIDDMSLKMSFQGDDGQWNCFARAREEQQQFIFYSYAPIKVPEERRPAMGEFINRANYGMIIGNFEIDYSDGEVRYKTSIDVEDAELVEPLCKNLVYQNVLTMDRYYKGIMAVAFGGMSAEAAVRMIESPES